VQLTHNGLQRSEVLAIARDDGDAAQIMKVFLIVAPPEEDGMLQLDQVWALEAETRSVSRQEVIRETTVEDPMQLTLRIRCAPDAHIGMLPIHF
jgi:hypothetical protein